MPIRLLVVADPKMLPALTNGLREGGHFDVLAAAISDAAAALTGAERAEAIAIFYGTPDRPLPVLLQAFAAKARARGAKLVGVLQKEQASQRDECFRAGAHDVFFMPLPRDQFVQRLAGSLSLQFAPDALGGPARVTAVGDAGMATLDATVTPAGVEADGTIPFPKGQVVRLSWGDLRAHGVAVQQSPAQIRFAGLSPDDEAQVREWLKSATATARTPPYGQPAARGTPSAGPPPGFADRRPVRDGGASTGAARTPMRVPPPMVSPPPPPASVPNGAPAAAAGTRMDALFDDVAPAASAGLVGAAPAAPVAASGPTWPVPPPLNLVRTATLHALNGKAAPAEASPALTASAKRIVGNLGINDRTTLDRFGQDSGFADALAARVALEAAAAEGAKLYSASPAAVVDNAAVNALGKVADEAAAKLQKEANVAVTKGSVDDLQLITGASAALARDAQNFRATADRLRGIASSPRLGGALDPNVVLPGQGGARPQPTKAAAEKPQPRSEMRDFSALDERNTGSGGKGRIILFAVVIAGLIAGSVNMYLSIPTSKTVPAGEAGPNVVLIVATDSTAAVTLKAAWSESEIGPLAAALQKIGVEKAALVTEGGNSMGVLTVSTKKLFGAPKKKPAN